MKYVVVPDDVTIVNKVTGKPIMLVDEDVTDKASKPFVFGMKFFVERYLLSAPAMLKPRPGTTAADALRRVTRLGNKFEKAHAGDIIGVEEADYKVVKEIIDALEWPPQFAPFAPQVLSMLEAWEAAEKQDEEWFKKQTTVPDDGKVSPLKAG